MATLVAFVRGFSRRSAETIGNVDEVQTVLGRRVLIENAAGYLRFAASAIPEAGFLAEVAARAGCGLLCDVNNVYVSSRNLGLNPAAYLAALPPGAIGEIHLAGHAVTDADGRTLLIDDHGAPVSPPVWALYEQGAAPVRRGPDAGRVGHRPPATRGADRGGAPGRRTARADDWRCARCLSCRPASRPGCSAATRAPSRG